MAAKSGAKVWLRARPSTLFDTGDQFAAESFG
jgi:hypothetical protein